jgi:sugar fermentation stimulation protein A
MKFKAPLIKGKFQKRYKRFFADINLLDGSTITAHTANTGSMKTCVGENWDALMSYHDSPTRKLKYSLEMLHNGKTWIGVNTSLTNQLAIEAINNGTIKELSGYKDLKPEAKIGNSRIDILLSNSEAEQCYVEVKNVTLVDEFNHCLFPDAVTERGLKHLEELHELKKQGIRTAMLFIVQRQDCESFLLNNPIDKEYSKKLKEVWDDGVEVLVYQCKLTPEEIVVDKKLSVVL